MASKKVFIEKEVDGINGKTDKPAAILRTRISRKRNSSGRGGTQAGKKSPAKKKEPTNAGQAQPIERPAPRRTAASAKKDKTDNLLRFALLDLDHPAYQQDAIHQTVVDSEWLHPDSADLDESELAGPEPELTHEEIHALLKAVANPKTPASKQLELLIKLGKVLDHGGPWLRVDRPRGRGVIPMTVREYLMSMLMRIRDKHGKLRELILNRAQKDYQTTCGRRSIILKARQLGMTTYVAARFFLDCITRPGTLAVQVAHDQRSAEQIFRIVHRMLENLPLRWRRGALKTSRANVRQIVFPQLDSEYRVETAADPNAGRGLTIQNLHCSEVARWPRDVDETLASLRAAVPPDGEIVLESTPDGAWGPFYSEWQNAFETGYTRHFYPWWWEPSYRRRVGATDYTEMEEELAKQHKLTSEQIAFRREMRANFGSRAPAEYAETPENCFLVSGECFFDAEIIQQQLRKVPLPISSADQERYLKWLPPMQSKEYIIGADPAGGGTQGDFSSAQVIERSTGIQCAEYRGHLTPNEFASRLALMARDYNHALIAVERNNHGHAVLSALHMDAGYDHVYRRDNQDGWLTNQNSRSCMLEGLRQSMINNPDMFKSKRFFEECLTFVRQPNGTCSAGRGAHDDTVIAMAIAQIVRAQMPLQPKWMMRAVEMAQAA